MTFLNLWLVAGAAFVALPVVLHLIMRQRPKLFEFPALRFIQKRHDTNQRRLRLRHLLLLALRAAGIALLAFALARPSVNLGGMLGSQEAPVAAALVFDAAPRMLYRHENRTRLEAAKDLGLWPIKQLPRESQIAVIDTRYGPAAFQVDPGAARQRIDKLDAVPNSQPLTAAIEEALRLLDESELERKEVYVFTDLARAAWPADAAARLKQRLAEVPGVGVYVVDVGVEKPTNCSLGELRLSGQILSNRSSLRVRTTLSCLGPASQRTVELYLLDGQGEEQKSGAQLVDLEPGASGEVDFRVGSLELGTHQGLVRVLGQDGLAADDVRYFSVEVQPPWRVLVAAPRPADRYAVFLTEALAPTEFRKRGQARFDCKVISLDQLAGELLEPYAVVCLVDPTPLEPAVWQKLGDYAAGGRGVAIFLGRNAEPVDSFASPQAQELLPGTLLRQARRPEGDLYLAPRTYEHPVLSAFADLSGGVPWNFFPVFRYWEFGKLQAGVGVVVRFSDGRPALLERPLGAGRVLTMSTPVSDDPNQGPWNLLPVGAAWPFGILANQMMVYLAGSSDQQLNYQAGQTVTLQLSPHDRRGTYLLTTPDQLSFPLSADLKQRLLVVTSTDEVGNYRVRAGGSASKVDRGFSVNLSPEQTSLERTDEKKLVDFFGKDRFRVARTAEQIDRDVSMGRVGRELFPALILLLAVVLAAEFFVANRFYRE